MCFGALPRRLFGVLGVLLAGAVSPAAWAVPIPTPGVFAEAVLEDATGIAVAGPVSFSAGQPGVADVNAFTGAGLVNEAHGRARLPGSTGSSTLIGSPVTGNVGQGHAEARQITNWKAIYRGGGTSPNFVEIDLLAVYRGSLGMGIGASGIFPGPGELFASVHAELNLHLAGAPSVTNVFVGDTTIDFFEFIELRRFFPTGPWAQDWTSTLGTSGTGGQANVDTFMVCRTGNPLCRSTLVPVNEVFGFEVFIRTDARAPAPGFAAESDFLGSIEGTPMIADPDFLLVLIPEPGTATLLSFALLVLGLLRATQRA